MEKLSELSKPVAWIIGEESIEEFKRGYETFVVRGDDVDSTEETMKLYSQEYVSALLAELEAKDKRIVALERINKAQEDHINQQQDRIESLEKKNGDLGHGLQAAEKRIAGLVARLATPVRLPEPCAFNLCDLVDRDAVIASLREQGFTVSEE